MARPNVILRDSNAETTNLRIDWKVILNTSTQSKPNIKNQRFRYDLNIEVPTKFWDKGRRLCIEDRNKFKGGIYINTQISNIVESLKTYYNECLANYRYPTSQELRLFLNKETNRQSATAKLIHSEKKDKSLLLIEQLDEFRLALNKPYGLDVFLKSLMKKANGVDIESIGFKHQFIYFIADKLSKKGIVVPSAKSYHRSLKTLLRFEDDCGYKLSLESMNLEFLHKFVDHSYSVVNIGQNNIALVIRVLKIFLYWSLDEGLTENRDWMSKKFVVRPYQPDTIALTEEEVRAVINFDYSTIESSIPAKTLMRGQEIFTLFFLQAPRFSDYDKITKDRIENVGGIDCFHYRMQKTKRKNRKATSPCHANTLAILEKYGGKGPTLYSVAYLINIFRELCFWAGITQIVSVTTMKKNLIEEKMVPKWQAVSIHTGRRTLATILFEKGVNIEHIRAILGHASTDQTRRYLRIGDKELAAKAATGAFFETIL